MERDIPMFYKHDNVILELKGSKGTLFVADKLIFKGATHDPISWNEIPDEYKNYNVFSDIMKY